MPLNKESKPLIICLHTIKGFKYRRWLDISIWLIDGTPTGITTLSQGEPDCNSNEGYSAFSKAPGLEPHYQRL